MDFVYLCGFYLLKFLVTILPNFVLNGFADFMAFCAYHIDKKHRKIIAANLDLCFKDELNADEKVKIIKNTYRNYAKFGIDFIKNQNTTREKILNKVEFENPEIFEKPFYAGTPIFVQTAHYGNWELFSLAFAVKYGKTAIIGRALDSKVMDKILSKNRTQFDIILIEKTKAAKNVIKCMKEGRTIGVLTDQNTIEKEGLEIKFFSRRAMHTPALSVFAQKMKALIIPSFIYMDGNKFKVRFFEPFDITKAGEDAILKATQYQADATEAMIRQKPDEYFWFHRRFKRFYKEIYEA